MDASAASRSCDSAPYTVATGKAILAHLPDDRINEIIEDQELEQRTEHTITDPDELQIELEQIREDDHV